MANSQTSQFPPPARLLFSVKDFSARNPALPVTTLRDMIFKAEPRPRANGETIPGNGLIETGAVIRCGRKVLIDETRFFAWLDAKNGIKGVV
jgi:hypothetical protein